ncbi:uncharacterized protein LOC135385894 [Ornithodoros turicata]|uniref:uncharacterized protein LOC135385894 n=1 Tax=Ornithodoros turicata TaxID=34597 RepID=UPI003139A66A
MICDNSALSFLLVGGGMKTVEAKVVVLGSQGVGKSSIVTRYSERKFSSYMSPTLGASFHSLKISVGDMSIKLQIWDTAGQERFRAMAPIYYRNANAAIVVYDITSAESFAAVKLWVQELKRNVEAAIAICLVGNKCDLAPHRAVPVDEAQRYAQSINAHFYECSALGNQGIEEIFRDLATHLAQQDEKTTADKNISQNRAYTSKSNSHTTTQSSSCHSGSRIDLTSFSSSESSSCAC